MSRADVMPRTATTVTAAHTAIARRDVRSPIRYTRTDSITAPVTSGSRWPAEARISVWPASAGANHWIPYRATIPKAVMTTTVTSSSQASDVVIDDVWPASTLARLLYPAPRTVAMIN